MCPPESDVIACALDADMSFSEPSQRHFYFFFSPSQNKKCHVTLIFHVNTHGTFCPPTDILNRTMNAAV